MGGSFGERAEGVEAHWASLELLTGRGLQSSGREKEFRTRNSLDRKHRSRLPQREKNVYQPRAEAALFDVTRRVPTSLKRSQLSTRPLC